MSLVFLAEIIRTTRRTIIVTIFLALLSGCTQLRSDVLTSRKPTASPSAININTASAEDLERIPYIGEKLAGKIVEYREEHGPFRRTEHLMLIQGISDKRFRKIRQMVKAE